MKKRIITTIMVTMLTVGAIAPKVNASPLVIPTISQQETQISHTECFYVDIYSEEFKENFIDLREVVGYEVTETGLMLLYSDGSGYYLDFSEENENGGIK